MSISNRASILNKIHKSLKKHYKVAPERGDQPVLDALLFACCLENAPQGTAHTVYDTVRSSFFDWNEIRVTTVKELAEVMHALPEAGEAAARLKNVLQSVFESEYSFNLDSLKKQNLGQAVKRLQKLDGVTPFAAAYVTQTALGGHAVPLDRGTLESFVVLGAASPQEAASGNVPGLERAIPKSKGAEFSALVHELGAEMVAHPFSTAYRDLLLSIAPDAKDRLPKRAPKKAPEPPPAPAPTADAKADGKKRAAAAQQPAGRRGEPAAAARKPADRAKKAPPPPPAKKKPAATMPKKKLKAKPLAKRKPR